MKSFFSTLTLCGAAAAQTVAFTDPATQISFQSWTNTANGYKVSLALPQAASPDLIAQIVSKHQPPTPLPNTNVPSKQAPLKDGVGWAGIAIGPGMLNVPLIAVWTNANKIQSSIRKADEYASPPVYKSDIVLKTIAAGTSSNATHLTYTFLCQKCALQGSRLGWAMSDRPVPTPENVDGSKLGFHSAGFGGFSVDLEKARNKGFEGWAATAA